MGESFRLSFRKGDWLAVTIVILLALIVFIIFFPGNNKQQDMVIQIYQNNMLLKECSSKTEATFTIAGEYNNTITIKDGKVAVTESTCPGADCVHSGWISQGGRSIVCLPNKVEIRIVGQTEVDIVVR